ncbi:hypothetical protein L3i20_v208480 [Paenibacillus sp. L3-i20]|nr:hypothetical protein L3i20_v208480 [Paenibacillus sp. L3-i20]
MSFGAGEKHFGGERNIEDQDTNMDKDRNSLSESSPDSIRQLEVKTNSNPENFITVTPIRRTIAMRTLQSVREIPHMLFTTEVDVTNLVTLRSRLKNDFRQKEGVNLTYLSFFIKTVVNAIKEFPLINSVWAVDQIIVKHDINISLLIGTEDSVLAPVIKTADQKKIAEIALEIDQLTQKARSGKLTLNDTQNGTFTINNTGAFGSILSFPTINYPQAALLTIESIVKKPKVVDDMIAVRSVANICLSIDSRIMEGQIAGPFLQRVKEDLEAYHVGTEIY